MSSLDPTFLAEASRKGLLSIPAELDLPPHARPRRYCQRARLEVPDESPGLQELNLRVGVDVPVHLPSHEDGISSYFSGDVRAGFDGEIAVYAHVSFEAARNPYMACPFDFPLDGQIGGDDRLTLL